MTWSPNGLWRSPYLTYAVAERFPDPEASKTLGGGGVGRGGVAVQRTKITVGNLKVINDQCCGSVMFIPNQVFFHPGSRIRIFSILDPGSASKNLCKYFNPHKWFLSSRKYDSIIILFVQGGSPTPHPFSSRPHFVCKFSCQRSTKV